MSYYCEGRRCPRREACARVQHLEIPALGEENGCWHVYEEDCIAEGYCDFVEKQEKEQ